MELNLKGQDIWCTNCSMVGHTKDNCRQDVYFVQKKLFCDIFQENGLLTKYFLFNMNNGKASWCTICEVKIHTIADYHWNLKNRQSYHAVYQTNVVT